MCWFRLPHFCPHMKIEVAVVNEIVKMLQRKVKYVQRTICLLVHSIFFLAFMSIFTFSKQSFNESFCNRSELHELHQFDLQLPSSLAGTIHSNIELILRRVQQCERSECYQVLSL